MASKIAIPFLIVFLYMQLVSSGTSRKIRETPCGKNIGTKIEEAVGKATAGIKGFVKQVKENEFVKKMSDTVGKLAQKAKEQGKELVHKIQKATSK